MPYDAESKSLDTRILGVIERWHRRGEGLDDASFNDLALRLFDYQLRYNAPYARYCAAVGMTAPRSWEGIPAVPAAAFKEAAITTFDPAQAALLFETSGTTSGTPGRHYMQSAALYDAALLAAFDRFVLSDGSRLRYCNFVPNPHERTGSSLGYMMGRVSERRGDGQSQWYLHGDELLVHPFIADAGAAVAQNRPLCIAATALALVQLLDALEKRKIAWKLPPGSRVMETGGFKGRSRSVERTTLYARLCTVFELTNDCIKSEYGMTELSSQYYGSAGGAYAGPPWLRTRVVGPQRTTLPNGEVGSLLHLDLANRSSCIAIQTEDLGFQSDEGLVLIGRDRAAAPRGCSLDAQDLALR
jgi:Acyl-protein synthetase, LuxE